MPAKGSGPATEWTEIDRFEADDGRVEGVGWLAYPQEGMQRASHAIAVDGAVWVLDPVDIPDLDDLLAELGAVAGVAVLLERHGRDAATIADRHGVPVTVPDFLDGMAAKLDAPVETVHRDLGDTGYGLHKLVDNRFWQEAALYGEVDGTLYVPESLGTNAFTCVGEERLGVQPFRRLTPPTKLSPLDPERLLVGHGRGITTDPSAALADALDNSRRRAPRALASGLRAMVGV